MNNKTNNLYIFLSAFFICNAVLAEIIGVKIFSLEKVFGYKPAQLNIFGSIYDFNLTAGVIIWPVVFVFTDVINEYFGKPGVRKISFLTAGLITYVFLILFLVSHAPPADFWLSINSHLNGLPFDINAAYTKVFSQSMGIIIGSLIAFLTSQLSDVYIFQYLRKITGSKMIWLRATGSTLLSQLIDSFIVLFIAFRLFGGSAAWSWNILISVCIVNYIYKFFIAILMTPVLYLIHYFVEAYLGKSVARALSDDAARMK